MIAFDIDGVLADARHREHHLAARPKDWEAFFAAAAADEVIDAGRAALQAACTQGAVVLVSGRPERLRSVTLKWLHDHGFGPLDLFLRRDEDRRPAAMVKSEILTALGGPEFIDRVYDDDPQVIAALLRQGYEVVHFGVEEQVS